MTKKKVYYLNKDQLNDFDISNDHQKEIKKKRVCIGIAKFYGGEWIWQKFWVLTALISLGLAFMNILPIPALDGGHVVFLLIEIITMRILFGVNHTYICVAGAINILDSHDLYLFSKC
jgi:membrane-associated protease RseP (regulator of RpoE activity)